MSDVESLILFIIFCYIKQHTKTTKNIKLGVNFEQVSENLCPLTVSYYEIIYYLVLA